MLPHKKLVGANCVHPCDAVASRALRGRRLRPRFGGRRVSVRLRTDSGAGGAAPTSKKPSYVGAVREPPLLRKPAGLERFKVDFCSLGEVLGFVFGEVSQEFVVLSQAIGFGVEGDEADDFLRVEFGILAQVEDDGGVVGVEGAYAEGDEHEFEFEGVAKADGFVGWCAEAIDDFAENLVELVDGFGAGQAFVKVEPPLDVWDVGVGQIGVSWEVDFGGEVIFGGSALDAVDGFLHEFGVHVEAYAGDVSALFRAEEISAAADFEVEVGDFDAGAEVGEPFDGAEAFACDVGEGGFAREEVAVGAGGGSSDAAPYLVELGQAEAFGMVDDEAIGGGDINAGFNDGRAEQDVEAAVDEFEHGGFERFFIHLAVCDADSCARHEAFQPFVVIWQLFDAIVQEVDLSAAVEFSFDGFGDEGI